MTGKKADQARESRHYDARAAQLFADVIARLVPRVETSTQLVLDAVEAQGEHAASPENLPFLALTEIVHLNVVASSTATTPEYFALYGLDREDSPAPQALIQAMGALTVFLYRLLELLAEGDAPIWVPEELAPQLSDLLDDLAEGEELFPVLIETDFFRGMCDNYLLWLEAEMACRIAFRHAEAPDFHPGAFGIPSVRECFAQDPFERLADERDEATAREQYSLMQELVLTYLDDVLQDDEDWVRLVQTTYSLN